ncbi:hypothetical protein spd_00003 [Shewanella phage Dolos]|nr:hypothetical protein spd_00003 [Shewanella phage Dolos]
MTLCVESKFVKVGPSSTTEPVLVVSNAPTCTAYYLVEAKDLDSQLSYSEVSALFSAIVGLYALAFVIKLARKQLGF